MLLLLSDINIQIKGNMGSFWDSQVETKENFPQVGNPYVWLKPKALVWCDLDKEVFEAFLDKKVRLKVSCHLNKKVSVAQ